MNIISLSGQINSVRDITVEPRLICAPLQGYIWVGQRLYIGRKAYMQSEGRFCTVGKGFIMVDLP